MNKEYASKVKKYMKRYPKEFTINPKGELYCNLCSKTVSCETKWLVDKHRASKQHSNSIQQNVVIANPSQQTFIQQEYNAFLDALVRGFSSANIPLHKLRNPDIKNLFQLFGAPNVSETIARNFLLGPFYSNHEIALRTLLSNKDIFLVVDESEINGTKYCNVLFGLMNNPRKTFVIDSAPSTQSFDSMAITRIVTNVVSKYNILPHNLLLLISDAARYMIKAGNNLKVLYPNLFHITCLAHLVHNCAMKIRSHYKCVDDLIACIKMLTVKNKTRSMLFQSIGLPPQVIITRWSSWLIASLYYSKNLPLIRNIVLSLPDTGVIVTRAQNAITAPGLVNDLISIKQCYEVLIEILEQFEKSTYTIQSGYDALSGINCLNDPVGIKLYLQDRLQKNDITSIVNHFNDNISPDRYVSLKQCIPTSLPVERSFSLLKKMLSSDRHFSPINVPKYLSLYYNKFNNVEQEEHSDDESLVE